MNKCLPPPNVISYLFQRFIKDIHKTKEIVPFLNFIASLLDLVTQVSDAITKNTFLTSILKRFADFFSTVDWSNEGKDKEVFAKLQEFLEKIIDACDNISEVLALEPFLRFVIYLPSAMKRSVCKKFLSTFADSNQKISDPILVHTLLSLSKPLNDDYGFSMSEPEKEEVARIVKKIALNVSFGKDIEHMLNFYTDIRVFFGNLPGILEFLIDQGLDIIFQCRKFSKRKITRQIFSFIQAAISFCLISISSIEDKVLQFDYYLKTAQVALLFNLTSQAETLCKSAIGLFADFPKKFKDIAIEDVMETKIKNLISFLIVLPENPENDYLHIFNGLYASINTHFKWSKRRGLFIRTRILCDCFSYICVELQEKLPYHVENIRSNDSLYTEPEYKTALFEKFQVIIGDITKNLKEINELEITETEPAIAVAKINLAIVNCFMAYILPCPSLVGVVKECLDVLKRNSDYLRASTLKEKDNIKGFIMESLKNIKKNLKDNAIAPAVDDVASECRFCLY